jgi:hypothetical protein
MPPGRQRIGIRSQGRVPCCAPPRTALWRTDECPVMAASVKVAYYARLGVVVKRLLTDNGRRSARVSSELRAPNWTSNTASRAPTGRDQRQGRALHPVSAARVGLRLDLPELGPVNPGPGSLAAPLQLPPATQWHRWHAAYLQTHFVKKQPLDASQLDQRLCRDSPVDGGGRL